MLLEPIQGVEAGDFEVSCESSEDGQGVYFCTLLPNHEGDHEAGVGMGDRCASWPQEAGD